nr:accessory Sec system protein Asp3 [Lactobacillus sp. ESL0701]
MRSKIVGNVYLFFCPLNLFYLYTYGAKINFGNDKISYENAILSPGQPLITWRNAHLALDEIPSMYLPILEAKQRYQFFISSTEQPHNSLSLAVTQFDDTNGQIKHDVFEQKSGVFTVLPQTRNYQLDLINLNNQKFEFTAVILAKTKTMSKWDIQLSCTAAFCLIKIQTKKHSNKPLLLHLQTKANVVQRLNFNKSYNHMFITLPLDQNGQFRLSAADLTRLVKQLRQLLTDAELYQLINQPAHDNLTKTIVTQLKPLLKS